MIYRGELKINYYLDKADIENGMWQKWESPISSGELPEATEVELPIPLLVTIPANPNVFTPKTKPNAGWDTIIYQHGIFGSRVELLNIANIYSSLGYATIAIDLPLHGIPGDIGAFVGLLDGPNERHFKGVNAISLDPENPLGKEIINLKNLLVARDNMRQGVTDLFTLAKALENMDYDGLDNGLDFNTGNVYFIGHSLGGIVGTSFLALDAEAAEPKVKAGILAMTGGGIAKLLEGSLAFGQSIRDGLEAVGIFQGTDKFDQYFLGSQTILDTVDPYQLGPKLTNSPILFIEVIDDSTIPNEVAPIVPFQQPSAGTEPLAKAIGLTVPVDSVTADDDRVWLKIDGLHRSLLEEPDAAAFETIHLQIEAFLNMVNPPVLE